MPVIDKATGRLIGKHWPGGQIVTFYWKNILSARAMASNPRQTQTAFQGIVKAKTSEYAQRYREVLSPAQKSLWEAYAASLPPDGAEGGALNIIPNRRGAMSALNAYIRSQVAQWLGDETGPSDIAPLGDPTPQPPTELIASVVGGVLSLSWTEPVFVGTPIKRFYRVWIMSNTKPQIHKQYAATVTPPMTTLLLSSARIGRENIPLSSITKGIIRAQMDTIVQSTTGRGMLISAGSNVAEASFSAPPPGP